MEKLKKLLVLLLVAVLFLTGPSAQAYAIGPYLPPALTMIVYGAPQDLQIVFHIVKEEGSAMVVLEPERRLWETAYRFRREAAWELTRWYGNAYDLQDTEIEFISGGESRRIPFPTELVSEHDLNDYITLYYNSGKMTRGFAPWRAPLLIGLRVLLLLAVKSLVFWLMGYRLKKSWLRFALINLVILGLQAVWTNGWINFNPMNSAFYFMFCFLLVVAEFVALILLVNEQDRNRTARYIVYGNLAGELGNFLLFTYMPL